MSPTGRARAARPLDVFRQGGGGAGGAGGVKDAGKSSGAVLSEVHAHSNVNKLVELMQLGMEYLHTKNGEYDDIL